MAGNSVFVCSTCYDLIDIRAEVEELLRSLGFSPLLSDRALSDFAVQPGVDSIQTCLVNVSACDVFILILCRRYGPSLSGAGYPDLSATHLEYKKARKAGKPIFVYVRDHLKGVYDHWKKQNKPDDFESPWLASGDHGLLRLMAEHAKLRAGGGSNWLHTYQSSVDLKAIISKDLQATKPEVFLEGLIARNAVPDLTLFCTGSTPAEWSLVIGNCGGVPAHNVSLAARTKGGCLVNTQIAPVLPSRGEAEEEVWLERLGLSTPFVLELRYDTPTGLELEDVFEVQPSDVPKFTRRGKLLLGRHRVVLTERLDLWNQDSK